MTIVFLGQIFFGSSELLTSCNGNLKKDGSKHLTCNVYLKKNGDKYEYFFVPGNKPRERIYISMNAQKGFWDSCIVALKENESYIMINLQRKVFTIQRYANFQSLDSAYTISTGGIKKIQLHYSSGIYDSLAY